MMRNFRFEMAVAGSSFAARMAAALLAKHGKRVLLLSAPACRPPWQDSSLFAEKLLAPLGGRGCLAPNQGFQVLSSRARVTIRPGLPLAEELQREFGGEAGPVGHLLGELEETGRRLEELFWEHGGLPVKGMRETASWRWLCLRRKFQPDRLGSPLAERLRNLSAPAAEWLVDLFQGLAVQPLAALTVADGAMLWANARRPEGIDGDELATLLQTRFEQFHGVEAGLGDLAALEHRNGLWHGSLVNGGDFQAGELILGDLDQQLPGSGFPLPGRELAPPQQLVSSALDDQLSPLLEKRVIVGGSLPLRLVFTPGATGLTARISASVLADAAQIRRQLEPVLPFARYDLQAQACGRNTIRLADPSTTAPSLFKLPIRLGSQLWNADENRLIPHLGLGGALLLAWTLVRQLDPAAVPTGG